MEYTFPVFETYQSGESAQLRPRLDPTKDVTTSDYWSEFAGHYAKLNKIAVTPALWPEHTDRPNDAAIQWARFALQQFEEDSLIPTRVVASAEGGVAICFVDGNKYADIECFNTGGILGVTSNRRDRPSVWEILADAGEIARASARIRLFLDAPSTSENVPRWPRRR